MQATIKHIPFSKELVDPERSKRIKAKLKQIHSSQLYFFELLANNIKTEIPGTMTLPRVFLWL